MIGSIWVKAEKKDAELQNIIAEQKIRTQRILGELIQKGQRKGNLKTQATSKSSTAKELDDIGLSKKQSSTFQQIASIPEDDFEEFTVAMPPFSALPDSKEELSKLGEKVSGNATDRITA